MVLLMDKNHVNHLGGLYKTLEIQDFVHQEYHRCSILLPWDCSTVTDASTFFAFLAAAVAAAASATSRVACIHIV